MYYLLLEFDSWSPCESQNMGRIDESGDTNKGTPPTIHRKRTQHAGKRGVPHLKEAIGNATVRAKLQDLFDGRTMNAAC
jgi:hypothetical protein